MRQTNNNREDIQSQGESYAKGSLVEGGKTVEGVIERCLQVRQD